MTDKLRAQQFRKIMKRLVSNSLYVKAKILTIEKLVWKLNIRVGECYFTKTTKIIVLIIDNKNITRIKIQLTSLSISYYFWATLF